MQTQYQPYLASTETVVKPTDTSSPPVSSGSGAVSEEIPTSATSASAAAPKPLRKAICK